MEVKIQAKYLPVGWSWIHTDSQTHGCLKSPNGTKAVLYDTRTYKQKGWIAFMKPSENEWKIYYNNDLAAFQRFAEFDAASDRMIVIKRTPLF